MFDKLDTGKISAVEFCDGVRELAGNDALTDEEIIAAWNALLIGVAPENHGILMDMKAKYRTFLLSNNNEIHYDFIMKYLKEEFDLEDNSSFFEKDYYSHLMGLRKPGKEIFEYVLKEHDLVPERTLFIDDSPQHLETAKTLGIQTALISPPETLSELVIRLGL